MTCLPKYGILSSWSVKSKVSLGFAIVLVLHVTIAVISHFGMQKARDDLATYDRFRAEADDISEIDSCVGELQRVVMLYTQTGHESARTRAGDLYDTLRELVTAARNGARNSDQTGYFSMMLEHVRTHQELFDAVTLDRARRKQLFDNTLSGIYARVHESLDDICTLTEAEALTIRDVESSLYTADADVVRYLRSPDSALVRSVKKKLRNARAAIQGVAVSLGDDETRIVSQDVVGLIDDYEDSFIQMVQATRGYLHLVNVVMAGEAAEFARLSKVYRHQVDRGVGGLAAEMAASAVKSQWIINTISIATIVLGILAAMWISRDVAPPLNAITRTLEGLATGEKCDFIPGVGRRDEVGRLAAAAEVFKNRADELELLYQESRRAEDELSRYTAELELRNQELDEFTHVASHDLQEPLRKLVAFSTLLPQHLPAELPEQADRDLEFIVDAAKRMKRLVQALLELSRAGKSEMTTTTVDLDEVIDDVCSVLSERIDESRATIIRDNLPVVEGDPRLLTQLYQNLIGNALKFVNPGQSPEIRVTAEFENDRWNLGVSDKGIGINPRYSSQIFSPFKRLHSREEYDGSGIGLSICRKVVERHGGQIWVESGQDHGSHIHFHLGEKGKNLICDAYPVEQASSC